MRVNLTNQGCGTGEVGHYVACADLSVHNEPNNQICRYTPRILDASLKQRYHRHRIYKMIYVQTRVKGQDSHELALEMEK